MPLFYPGSRMCLHPLCRRHILADRSFAFVSNSIAAWLNVPNVWDHAFQRSKFSCECLTKLDSLFCADTSSEKYNLVQLLSRVRLLATLWTAAHQASLSIINSRSPPKPCPLSWWCHPTISSSVVPFSSCPQCFPASGSFQISQLFASGGQSVRVSVSTSDLPMNTQDLSPLGWTGRISLQSKELSRVFSNTTVQKHQFFHTQLSSRSNSHIYTWPLEKPQPWLDGPLLQSNVINHRNGTWIHPWIMDHRKSKRVPDKHLFLLYWLCQSLWLCGSQQTV